MGRTGLFNRRTIEIIEVDGNVENMLKLRPVTRAHSVAHARRLHTPKSRIHMPSSLNHKLILTDISKDRDANMHASQAAYTNGFSNELLKQIKTNLPFSSQVDNLKVSQEIMAWLSSLAIPMPEFLQRLANTTNVDDFDMRRTNVTVKPFAIAKMLPVL